MAFDQVFEQLDGLIRHAGAQNHWRLILPDDLVRYPIQLGAQTHERALQACGE